MKLEVNENGTLQLEEVFNGVVIKTTDGVKFHICQRDYGIEITCNGVTKYLDEETFNTKEKDKHTPGPWIVVEDQVGDNDGNVIADVTKYNEWNTTEGIVTKEMPWEANARLMAAAPHMYEFIKKLTTYTIPVGVNGYTTTPVVLQSVVDSANNLIAKIEGDEE